VNLTTGEIRDEERARTRLLAAKLRVPKRAMKVCKSCGKRVVGDADRC
jgi:hypothetical protein